MFNSLTFNEGAFNAGQSLDITRTYSPDQPFILHLMTLSSGSYVFDGKIEGWTGAKWEEGVNAPGSLKITLPIDNAMVAANDFVHPKQIWIYDASMEPLRRYYVTKTISKPLSSEVEVNCKGLLYLLKREYAPIGSVAGATQTVKQQIVALMNYQVSATPIPVGRIDPAIGNLSHVRGVSADKPILSALMLMWKQIGGVMGTDHYGRFTWYAANPDTAQYTMSLYDDIQNYEYTVDYSHIANRIYSKTTISDNGSTHIRRPISDGGNNYVEDTASQTAYGIRPLNISPNVEDPTEMVTIARETLAKLKDPVVSRRIGVIDLARVRFDDTANVTPRAEYIYPGSSLRVIPPSISPGDSPFTTIILTLKRDLSDPLKAEITVGEINTTSAGGRDHLTTDDPDQFFNALGDLFQSTDENFDTSEDDIEDVWGVLDLFREITSVESTDGDIQPIGEANDAGVATDIVRADHVHKGIQLIEDASWTQKSDLGAPDGAAIGYLDSDAGTDAGYWIFPHDGDANSDWIPLPSYN